MPFETLGRHVDHAHSDETSHETRVLPELTKNLDPPVSTKDRIWGLGGGLEISNLCSNFMGLRESFLFRSRGGEQSLHGPGGPKAVEATCAYSTRPSSTTYQIVTPQL